MKSILSSLCTCFIYSTVLGTCVSSILQNRRCHNEISHAGDFLKEMPVKDQEERQPSQLGTASGCDVVLTLGKGEKETE
jgi:hypothetical protein